MPRTAARSPWPRPRAQSGRLRLGLEPVEVAALLEEAASLNASYAERYQARLRVEAAAGLHVKADRKRLLQVIGNFVANAAKFSPLAICKALVERMGGRIGYETAPGGGASFFAELPAAGR